jgi:hypothetical protein
MKKIIFCLIIILIPTFCLASIQYDNAKQLAIKYANMYNVDPAFLIAVMHIESRNPKTGEEFRFGKMGKTYYGPCGIHKDFLKKWPIDNLETNIEAGARALRGVGYNESLQKRRLHRYNASCNSSYLKAVMSAKRKYAMQIK